MSDNGELKNNDSDGEIDEESLSIGDVIDSFLHRVLDIEDSAFAFLSLASKKYNESAERIQATLSESQRLLDKEDDDDRILLAVKGLRKAIREADRHNNSSPVATLEKSLFIYLFAVFDKYIGDLIAIIYQSNPKLYKNINREISLSEALKYESMDEFKQEVLNKEIEALRRKGYIEQFKDMENKFSIKLTKFSSWPHFIECSQRRNLFTHCDGIVSRQYLDVCNLVGLKREKEPAIGEQLEIGSSYFFQSCHIVCEVGVMLGQTLWRKTQENNIESADSHLSNMVFDFLHMEHWAKAIIISKFALGLPKISSDATERIFTVNYAIGLKAIDKASAAKNILDRKDWSASTYDFKLAYAVLTENYSEAQDLMTKLGKQGELVSELAYHDWPLFREF